MLLPAVKLLRVPRGLLGAALAAEKAGDKDGARRYYAKLAAQTGKAGDSRSELAHVREYLAP